MLRYLGRVLGLIVVVAVAAGSIGCNMGGGVGLGFSSPYDPPGTGSWGPGATWSGGGGPVWQ